ncbi:hypothetical protein N7448_007789 [Penicillium atrosanguineum]|nr:hypothetical protein N7448_007789 [Penicillium atrosanguineum]
MDSTRTISELKSAFVRSQVRILSEKLELPQDWRSYAVETEEGDLGEKVIEDVLHKGMFPVSRDTSLFYETIGLPCVPIKNASTKLPPVNATAKQHNRVVYSSQAIHHVAHQIATLYWSSISQENFLDAMLHLESSPTLLRNITNLPLEIESQGAGHEETARYQQLRERLASLDQQRQQRQRRLDQLRHLQRLTEPFKDPQKNIQPNLVTRDGELIQELENMRMLVARVGGEDCTAEEKQQLSRGPRVPPARVRPEIGGPTGHRGMT